MNLFECFPSYYFCPHRLWRKTELDSVCSGRLPRELFYNLFSHMINGFFFFFFFFTVVTMGQASSTVVAGTVKGVY